MLLLQTDNVCLTKRVTMLFDFDADESKASYFLRSLSHWKHQNLSCLMRIRQSKGTNKMHLIFDKLEDICFQYDSVGCFSIYSDVSKV